MNYRFRLLLAALFALYLPESALAHSVYIFAWVDGEKICTESYFTRSSKVRGGEVVMMGAEGVTIARGITGEDGLACFPLPDAAQALEFTVLAGAGHKGRFRLEEKDVRAAADATQAAAERAAATDPNHAASVAGPENAASSPGEASLQSSAASEQLLRSIVQDELQKQLSPMRRYLAENLESNTPELKDIIGGMGWLFGLGAFGFWFSQRKKR